MTMRVLTPTSRLAMDDTDCAQIMVASTLNSDDLASCVYGVKGITAATLFPT